MNNYVVIGKGEKYLSQEIYYIDNCVTIEQIIMKGYANSFFDRAQEVQNTNKFFSTVHYSSPSHKKENCIIRKSSQITIVQNPKIIQ